MDRAEWDEEWQNEAAAPSKTQHLRHVPDQSWLLHRGPPNVATALEFLATSPFWSSDDPTVEYVLDEAATAASAHRGLLLVRKQTRSVDGRKPQLIAACVVVVDRSRRPSTSAKQPPHRSAAPPHVAVRDGRKRSPLPGRVRDMPCHLTRSRCRYYVLGGVAYEVRAACHQ